MNHEDDRIEFDGLPNAFKFEMETTFKLDDRKNFPDTCLYLLLQTQQNADRGLRPVEEVN